MVRGTRGNAQVSADEKASNARRSKTVSILIVDDHPVVREGLRALMKARDIQVVGEAANGQEALELARRLQPDVVLMDIRLPDMDGFAATAAIKQELPRTAIIMVTSYESREYLERALEVGASGYVLKGMPREAYLEAIRTVRAGGSIIEASLLAQLVRQQRSQEEPADETARALASLSPREREVLRLIARGLTNKEIAQQIHYSLGTVKNVVRRIIDKLGVSDRTQAAVLAARAGLTEDR
jgi:RNA polymerase sigma factor (sigma-70 family)